MAAKKTAKKVVRKLTIAKAGIQAKKPKSKPPKQDPNFRGKLDRRVEKLTLIVRALLSHPKSDLILAKEWMHDESIPLPSTDLLAYVAHEMLYGSNRMTYFEAAASKDVSAAFSCFVDLTSRLDDLLLKHSIQNATARITFIGWWGGENRSHWWLCRWGMDNQHNRQDHKSGAHRIALAIMEILVARALHLGESKQIDGLARIVEAANGPRSYKGQAATEIALLVFKWYRHLEGKLDRAPSRAELRAFIGDVDPEAPTSNDAWNEGLRFLLLPLEHPRRIHSDGRNIANLALLARKTGPQYPILLPKKEKPVEPGWVFRARGG